MIEEALDPQYLNLYWTSPASKPESARHAPYFYLKASSGLTDLFIQSYSSQLNRRFTAKCSKAQSTYARSWLETAGAFRRDASHHPRCFEPLSGSFQKTGRISIIPSRSSQYV